MALLGALATSFAAGYATSGGTADEVTLVGGSTPPLRVPADADEVGRARREEIGRLLARRYARPLGADVVESGSVEDMLRRLRDPYTAFLSPGELAVAERSMAGSYSGVGLHLSSGARGFVVTRLQPGSPAQAAGIRRGDVITGIDEREASDLGVAEAVQRLTGRVGSRVRVRLRSPKVGRETWIPLTRRRVDVPAVHSRVVGPARERVMVVRVERFSTGVADQVERRLAAARRAQVRGLVLDLRGNPGGLVEEAVGVCSVFLDGGPVAQTAGAHAKPARLTAARGGDVTMPLVVAVDGRTASSAEIVAAALQERHRATVVGSRTYGKTSVQEIVPLVSGGALRLTVSHYRTSAGRDLSGAGVRPQEPIRSARAIGHAVALIRAAPPEQPSRRAGRRTPPRDA